MLRLKQITLLLGDLVGLYLGFFLALSLRQKQIRIQTIEELITPMSLLFLGALVVMFIVGLYDISKLKNSWTFYQKFIISAIIWMGLGVAYFYLVPSPAAAAPKTILLLTAIIGFGISALWRWVYNSLLSTTLWQTRIIFAGLTPEVNELMKLLVNEPQRGYLVIGLIVASNETVPSEWSSIPQANSLTALNVKNINLLVIAPQYGTDKNLAKELYPKLFEHVQILRLEQFYEEIFKRIPPFTFSESWFLSNLQEQQKKIYDRVRVLVDYIAAVLMGLIWLITFPFVAIAIKLTSSGPIFYHHTRLGRNRIPFTIYKYRTMKVLAADGSAEISGPQFAMSEDNRITKVGKFLRRTRLDEIPQFINILKNEMSLIGPRPERPEFVEQITTTMPFYPLRHLIKPGLMGWAQLHQDYYGTIEENLRKLEYDLYYIKNRGFLIDVAIILRTVNVVVGMKGR